ncbi:hypothetical protein ACTFP3_29125 [Bacillus cereus group sp. MYBK5-2]|uniref:hypothetical protein n=1 Tax=Bacillus cereus group sp. MYBK5-2 TaxID=3450622 RepID=UPI003F79B878
MEKFNIETLFLSTSLYEELDFPEDYKVIFKKLFLSSDELQFDCFCIHCEKESTFKFNDKTLKNPYYKTPFEAQAKSEIHLYWNTFSFPIQLEFACQRNHLHKYSIMFISQGNDKLIKIGQYPSIASLELHSINKYRKILKSDYRDFSKAIRLYSHDVGAGSFVYLRRIFENLIEECRQEAQKNHSFDNDAFQRSRMDEKIMMLQTYLPPFLVENRKLYGILSKGIHELDEKTCLELFPNVKLAIELILDEKLYQLEKENKIQSSKKFIAAAVEKLMK